MKPRVRLGATLVAAIITACSGDKAKPAATSARSAPMATVTTAESAGDVVIPASAEAYKGVSVQNPGTLSGTVTLKGVLAELPPAPTGNDGAACGGVVRDNPAAQKSGGLGGVVVWLEGIRSGKPLSGERRVELESDRCMLVPRVQAAVVGSAVNIVGHDDFRQHLRFASSGETAPRATVLLGGGEQVIPTELPFKMSGMVMVDDPDHAWTKAYLAVFDHPYFAVTGADGKFSVEGIPAGTYTVHLWHERAVPLKQQVTVAGGSAATMNVELAAR